MFARSTTIHAHPSYIDAGIRHVRDTVMPVMADIEGCVGVSLLIDRDSGRCIVTSSWLDEDSLRAGEDRVRPLRNTIAGVFRGTTEVSQWEIAVMHREHHASRGAWCWVVWLRSDPAHIDHGIDLWKLVALPQLEELDGFCSASLIFDRATGHAVASQTFDSADSLERNRKRLESIRVDLAREAGPSVLEACGFELVIARLSVPEMV